MIEVDANEHYLQTYLSGEEQMEDALECFLESVDNDFIVIMEIVDKIQQGASTYEYLGVEYDFSEEVLNEIKERL